VLLILQLPIQNFIAHLTGLFLPLAQSFIHSFLVSLVLFVFGEASLDSSEPSLRDLLVDVQSNGLDLLIEPVGERSLPTELQHEEVVTVSWRVEQTIADPGHLPLRILKSGGK